MSAAVQNEPAEPAQQPEQKPAKKSLFHRKAKGEKAKEGNPPEGKRGRRGKREPKAPKPRQHRGPAPYLLLFALLTGLLAAVVLYYPIPGLTAGEETATKAEEPEVPDMVDAAAQSDMDKREEAVAAREAELKARETALATKEEGVNRMLKELGVSADGTTGAVGTSSVARVAKMYASMPPYKAAPLMAALDGPTAVEILRLMTEDEAGAVLAAMEASRGAQLMRELAKPATSSPTTTNSTTTSPATSIPTTTIPSTSNSAGG